MSTNNNNNNVTPFSAFNDTLLEFDRYVNPNPNPNPNPTFNSNPIEPLNHGNNSIDPSNLQFNVSTSQTTSSNNLFTVTIPRKRRRGRPRSSNSTIPSDNQVFSIPQYNSNDNSNKVGSFGMNGSLGNGNFSVRPNSNAQLSQDLSEEIIVINRDATSEALTALTAGFPADSLTDEEIDAGVLPVVGGIEQVNYILIRNHIITKWRENVSNWVSKEMLLDVVPKHCHWLLDTAYDFLVSHGYVNFGVANSIKERFPTEASKGSVIIIGAGMAGLSCARQLMRFGFKVTVLEGRKRAGGRVYTKKMEGLSKIANADLGGSVLTGTLGNPLGILARQLNYSLHKVRDKCPLYRVDGSPVDSVLDSKVETAFNQLLDKASRLRQMMGEVSQDVSLGAALDTYHQGCGDDAVTAEEISLFNWHLANLEYANAGLVSKLSLAFWDQDDPFDMGGDHCFLTGGNGKLVQALAENVPIMYEKTVTSIQYGSNGVQVTAGNQVYEGEMALCTVPLGVLKSGSIKFIPELPQRKIDGIKRLGFGLLNKVAMLFPHVFWGTDLDTFGHLSDNPLRRGEFFLFYSYATVAGGPLLIALVAGEAAHSFESMPPTDAVTHVLQILRGIYEPQGITVPEPIQTVCTRWGSDPYCLGSYSNVAVGASGDDYDILAESVGDGRLFFAGEATTRRYPATMHGAFLSGLREAANMAHCASARSLNFKIERSHSKNAHTCASLLADLFREPDLEFGSFSIIFEKNSANNPKSAAILRVTFTDPRKKGHETSRADTQHSKKLLFQQLQSHFNEKQQIHVYTLLSREQAHELREVRGGDDKRLNYLSETLGVKLVGRKGLGPTVDSLIASIKAERGDRKSTSTSAAVKSGKLRPKGASGKGKMIRRAKVIRNRVVPVPSTSSGVSNRNVPGPFTSSGAGNRILPVPSASSGVSNGLVPHLKREGSSGFGTPTKLLVSENLSLSSEARSSVSAPTSSKLMECDNKSLLPCVNPNTDTQLNFTAASNMTLDTVTSGIVEQ